MSVSPWLGAAVLALSTAVSCAPAKPEPAPRFSGTLREYAARARLNGSREALVPYGEDEEEGEMVEISSVDQVLPQYAWVVGEPIEETTFTLATISNSIEPNSIFTVYRFRVTRRAGKSRPFPTQGLLENKALSLMSPRTNEILVIKSGGNVVVDGVLLKKRGSLCFSELLPHPYLLALMMDNSNRIGLLGLGCRGIFPVEGDGLTPRVQTPEPLADGIKAKFGNSLEAFLKVVENVQK